MLHAPHAGLSYEERQLLRPWHLHELRAAVEREERGGYTLVEMLVAMGLVVVMMTLFATIFQMATQAMTVQKGMATNDHKVRLVQSALRVDLNGDRFDKANPTKPLTYRTFRNLIPFAADENGYPHFSDTDRSGYFYISENDPDDDTDDVLQFTVRTPDSVSDRFYGKVATLLPNSQGLFGPNLISGLLGALRGFLPGTTAPPGDYWPDQPEFDDFQGTPNGLGSSTMAEIAYFLRHGNLYRRVMLIRKPNVPNPPNDYAPLDLAGNALSLRFYENGQPGNFFADFDFAAFQYGTSVRFHGGCSMSWYSSAFSLTNPAYRFGFDNTSDAGKGYGIPREYVGTSFIGRFTHAETSSSSFRAPGKCKKDNNPFALSTKLMTNDGVVTSFPAGPRLGDDLLVSNVHGFDIKVWDPAASAGADGLPGKANYDDDGINGIDDPGELGAPGSDDGAFRDLGHRGTTGHYRYLPVAGRPNNYYSNSDMGFNRYDSWSPNIDLDGDGKHDHPPFRPIWIGPDLKPGKAHFDDDGINGIDDAGELGWPGTDDFAPLHAVQIKVRFYDEVSRQLREATAVISLGYCP